jgi:hypothetical protein
LAAPRNNSVGAASREHLRHAHASLLLLLLYAFTLQSTASYCTHLLASAVFKKKKGDLRKTACSL